MPETIFPVPPAPTTPPAELAARLGRTRAAMLHDKVDFVVLTSRPNIEYFTDYATLSWAYNARPIFAIVSRDALILIASRADARNLGQRERPFETILYDGFLPEAARAVVTAISARDPSARSTTAIDYGQDNLGRGSLELVDGLRDRGAAAKVIAGADLLWRVRMIKTPFEAGLKRVAFKIVNAAFDEALREAYIGMTELELVRILQAKIVLMGAERADPIAMLFSKGDFIYNRLPGERRLEIGHYIWTDFRSTYGGYPADRNRIARAGAPADWEVAAYSKVRALTHDLCRSVRPGQTGAEIYRRFTELWGKADLGPVYGLASRIGHGGGIEVTEPPSIMQSSREVIESGMILHIEPKLETNGAVFQFEEIIFVRPEGVEFLSDLAPEQLPIVER